MVSETVSPPQLIAVDPPAVAVVPSRRVWIGKVRKLPWLPILLLAPLFVFGIFGPWLWPYDPAGIDLTHVQQPPAWLEGGSWAHLLGTDAFGRDIVSTLMEGARVSLVVALVGTVGSALIGITIGLVAGYYGGRVDSLLMQLVDVKMSIPATLMIILLGAALGGGLTTIVVSIVLLFWASFARVVRGQTLTLRERGYVALARVANCGDFWIITRHILPNLLATCVVLFTIQIGRAITTEAGISFLGLGVQPPYNAWGLMVSQGRNFLATAWWIPTMPGLAITLTVLGSSLLGDWVRDALDSRTSQI
jgi:peptide/nickel transport system permease protein